MIIVQHSVSARLLHHMYMSCRNRPWCGVTAGSVLVPRQVFEDLSLNRRLITEERSIDAQAFSQARSCGVKISFASRDELLPREQNDCAWDYLRAMAHWVDVAERGMAL